MRYSTPWVQVDGFHFSDSIRDDESNAGRFRVLPSPFMFPAKVRLLSSEDMKNFSLEFEYATAERVASGNFSDNLKIFYGMTSKRIRKLVWTDTDLPDVGGLSKMVGISLDKFARVIFHGNAREDQIFSAHFKIIRKTVADAASNLIRYLKEDRDSAGNP